MATTGAQNLSSIIGTYLDATGVTPTKIKENAAIQKKAGDTVAAVASAVGWLINNWQLAVIGVVAILVIIRD